MGACESLTWHSSLSWRRQCRPAPRSPPPEAANANGQLADLIKDWQGQKEMLLQLAKAMPAKKFGYKPTPRQRTYGEQILHVAIATSR